MNIGQGLYVKNSIEAVEIYKQAFGLELGYHVLNPDGTYFHSELCKDDQVVFSVVEAPNGNVEEHTVQLSVDFDSEESVRRAYAILSEGGRVETPIGPMPWTPCAAEVIDRFGVWWYITAPGHRPPDDYDPNVPWDPSMYKKPE